MPSAASSASVGSSSSAARSSWAARSSRDGFSHARPSRDGLSRSRLVVRQQGGRAAVRVVRAAAREQPQRRTGELTAGAVEQVTYGTFAVRRADAVGPVGARVVHGEVRTQPLGRRHLGRAARRSDDAGAAVLGVLREERAHSARRAQHEHDVTRLDVRPAQYAHDGAAGSDHGDGGREGEVVGEGLEGGGVGYRQLGVAARYRAEVDGHAAAEPASVGALAERLDGRRRPRVRGSWAVRAGATGRARGPRAKSRPGGARLPPRRRYGPGRGSAGDRGLSRT